MIISISGVPGSGKTSVAHILAERLGMAFYSMGGLRAKMALEKGMTIDELNALGEKDKSTDTSVDDYQKELGRTSDNFIVEGRLSWHFIPHSFKIFLACDPMESARRVFQARHTTDDRHDEVAYETIEHTRDELDKRMASDRMRYEKYYGVNYQDPSHYDLIIDTTTKKGPGATAEEILKVIKEKA